jgi:integrase
VKHLPGLYRRKNGIYWFAKQINGVRKFRSLKTKDLQDAIKLANALDTGKVVPDSPIEQLIEPFLNHKTKLNRYTAASVDSKGPILRKFAKFTNGCPVADIDETIIQTIYEAQIDEGLSPETAVSYISTLRALFKWAVKVQKLIPENPCNDLHLARVSTKARKDFCKPELVENLIANCPREDVKFVLFAGFHAGMRKGEIIEARPFWFDLRNRQIHMRKHDGIQFKDQEERSIPMTTAFAAFLEQYGLRDPYLLRPEVKKGKSLYRYDFERPFTQYIESCFECHTCGGFVMKEEKCPKCGGVDLRCCDWITTHIMRHTFASLLASAGESIYDIAVWLGDDVRVVQKHYAKLLPMKRDLGVAFQSASSSAEVRRA